MPTQPYLTVGLFNAKYGVEANLVREIFPLPELRTIPEMPGDVIGVLNLRGTIIPVMHLAKRLGLPLQHCRLSDSVVVIDWNGIQMGLVVHETFEVLSLDESAISAEPDYGRLEHVNTAFMAGIATVDDELISLIATEPLLREPDKVAEVVAAEVDTGTLLENRSPESAVEPEGTTADLTSRDGDDGITEPFSINFGDFYELYCPQVTPADRAIFQLRAENLRQQLDDNISDSRERVPLAIVGLNDEYFGIELKAVKEFITVGSVTHIPCCPRHIIGSTNLRGEILVLVDVRSALNLSAGSAADEDGGKKAIVVEVDELVAGVLVDEIYDVDYVPSNDIASVPSNISDAALEYLKGTLPFKQGMLSILDMSKLIGSGRFVVDEVV